jgi:S-adenosylmethionine:tRNA ribosyltransferase-isomerase
MTKRKMNDDAAEAAAQRELEPFDYALPPECIAQQPSARRDDARLLLLERSAAQRAEPLLDRRVRDLPGLLRAGDLVVMNATRVMPAKLMGHKSTGGAVEALLLGKVGEGSARYRALVRSSGRLRVGQKFAFSRLHNDGRSPDATSAGTPTGGEPGLSLEAELVERGERGEVFLQFADGPSPYSVGSAPLPPYIRPPDARARSAFDDERYQTVFARVPGAVAAPTAGLHFTRELLAALDAAGIQRAEVVLHVGAGTFRPLDAAALASGRLHAEAYSLPRETADAIAQARARGGRVVAIGTTTTRVLESCADDDSGGVRPGDGETDLFLRPGSRFRVVDAMLTNFHLPRSSLLLLVAAFAGREPILDAYREAIARGYRFYSYGDAMLIT